MEVAESHVDGNLNNEKESEVSSTCNDSLPVSTPSSNRIETGAGSIAPSSLIQEEIIHSDSPDTSGASAGQSGREVHIKSEAEQSELSDNTEHVGIVQSPDAAAVEHENLLGVGTGVLQHIPGENIQLLNIIEDSEIVLLDESVVISTTSEPTTFIMSYENQEEMQDVEMSTTDNTGFQLEIPQSINVSSAKASENVESVDILSNGTKICSWNPDSTTIEIAEGSNNENETILFTEEEVSTTEEDVGNLVSTSNAVTPGIENVLSTSGDNTSVPSTTKAESICGTSVQEVVQDMHTSQSHTRDSTITETAPQSSGISTTCVKDINISQRRKRWDQVKSVAETSPVEQVSCESQASDSKGQTHNPLPEPSTSKQESHVSIPVQSVCTSKKPKDHNPLSNPIQDCVSSSKDIDIVNKALVSKTVFTRHQESNIDTTTKVNTMPQLSSALDLIKSSYYSPFDDEIPSPGSSTHEEQKYTHDSTNHTGECSTTNSSSNENLNILTKDQTSSLTSSDHQEKVISDSNISDQNLEGETKENKSKGNVEISIPSPGLSDESKEKKEEIILGNASASTVTEDNLQQPTDSMIQSETMLSKPIAKTIVKHHTAQHTSLAKQTVTSSGKPSVSSETNLLGDLKEMITSNKKPSVIDSKTPVLAEKFSGVDSVIVPEATTGRTKETCVVTDLPTVKRESSGVTEAATNKESSDVSEKSKRRDFSVVTASQRREESSSVADVPTTKKESLSVIKETLLTTKASSVVTKSATTRKESSVLVTEASAGRESIDVTEAPTTKKESSILTEVSTLKGNTTSTKEKDPVVVNIKTSVKGMETSLLVTEVQREKELLDDGLKVSTEEKETSVLGTESFPVGEETSVVDRVPMKEKDTSHSVAVTPMKEKDASFVDEKITAMGVEESVDNKQPSLQVKEFLDAGVHFPAILKETSAVDIQVLRKENEMSVIQTQMKVKEPSAVDTEVLVKQKETTVKTQLSAKETLITGIQASDLEKETSVASQAQKESLVSDTQRTLTISKQVLDKDEHTAVLCVPSKAKTIPFEIQVLPKEEKICVTNTQVSIEKENTSLIGPDVTERDNDSSGLQESIKRKETLTEPGKHTSPTAMQLPILKKETCTAGTHTQKKNEFSVSCIKTPEKDSVNVMEALEVDAVAADVISPKNKDKEIIRKRFVEVIAKQKTPTDSHIPVSGMPSLKMQTVTDTEFPVLAGNLAAAMKETIKKAISKMPDKSDLEAVAPKQSLAASNVCPSEAKEVSVQEATLSTSSSESNKQTADITAVEGLTEVIKGSTDEENLTSVIRKPSISVNLPVKTEDPSHRTTTAKDLNLAEISVSAKEALPKTESAITLGIKEISPIKQTIFKEDSILTEQMVLSKDADKKEDKQKRGNLAVQDTTGSPRKETQKLTGTSFASSSTCEQLKSSVLPPTKRRIKLVRPILSGSKESNKPEHSSSMLTEVTKSEPSNSTSFKDPAVEMALSPSQKECKETTISKIHKEIKMSGSMTFQKDDDTSHNMPSTKDIKITAEKLKEADLPNKAASKECDQSEVPALTEPGEIKCQEVPRKTLAKKVEKPELLCTSKKAEFPKTTALLKYVKPAEFSVSTLPGEIKQQDLPNKGNEKPDSLSRTLSESEQHKLSTIAQSAEVKQSDLPISVVLKDVRGPEFPNTALTESTGELRLSSRTASKHIPRLVAHREQSSSFPLKEKVPLTSEDIWKSADSQQASKEVTRSAPANVKHAEIPQSSLSAAFTSNEVKDSLVQSMTKPERDKKLEQPGLLFQKDSDLPEESYKITKLQDVMDKHTASECVKKPKLIRPLKSCIKDVPDIKTVSESDRNETKFLTEENILKEGLQEIVIKQQNEESQMPVVQSTELCTEKKGHEKTLSSITAKTIAKSNDKTTFIGTSNIKDQESNIQKSDISDRHKEAVVPEIIDPASRSDKEKCQLNVLKKETTQKAEHNISAETRTETSEIAIPHSADTEICKGEAFISTAQCKETKEDIFYSGIIKAEVANSSDNKLEQKAEIIDKRNIDSVSEELMSEKISLMDKLPQHSQTKPTVSSTAELESNLLESKLPDGKNFPVQSQFKIQTEKINTENISFSASREKVIAEAYSSNGSVLPIQSEISSVILKKPAVDMKSVLKPESSTNTAKLTLTLDTQAPKEDGKVLKKNLFDVKTAKYITLEGKAEPKLVQGKLHLEESKKEDKLCHEVQPQEFSTERKSEVSTITSSKIGAPETLDMREPKSEKNIQDKIILKITKDMTASKEFSSPTVKEGQSELKLQNSENISKQATTNTDAISKPKSSVESKVLSPDSSVMPEEHAKVDKLTLKLNKDVGSDSFTKDGTSSKSSWTSTVSSDVEQSVTVISPKHENINIKLKKDYSSLSFKAASPAAIAEPSHKSESADERAKVERLTLKLKKDVSKTEDIHKECIEEPKLEKITLKFKKDPAHPDIIVATTSMVISNPGEVIIARSSGVKQVETVASCTSQGESKTQKITLKLKKDGAKQEAVAVTSKDTVTLDTSVTPVQSMEIKLPETQGPLLKEEVSPDKIILKLKKDGSKSEALASPSKDNINQETTITPIKLKDGKIQEKPISPVSKDKPAVEKLTLKLKRDGTTATTSKEDIRPETTVTRVKASEVKHSDANTSGSSRIEPLVEKITLKLKKDGTKSETAVLPETTVTQVKPTEQTKPEVNVSVSPKDDPLVEKITLKLKKDGTKPETTVTSSKIMSSHETTIIPTKITDIKQKQSEANVSSLSKESTVVEKITLKIKKDPVKQDVTPATAKQGQTKITKGCTPIYHEEPKLEKLTLKLKKDSMKSSVVSEKEAEPSKQPDIVIKSDSVPKEENKVEKLTLKLKKDSAASEIITGKKVPEQVPGSLDIQNPEQSDIFSSKEEGKVEKLTLKLKKTERPEGDSEITSTQTEEEKCVDSATSSIAKEGKVEKITLKLRKDSTKSEEPVFVAAKETADTDAASENQLSADQETKLSEEMSSETGKPKKITLTLKKEAAWSVKRKKIKSADSGDSSKKTASDEMKRLNTEEQHLAEIPPKRAKIEEEMATSEKSESQIEEMATSEKSESHVTSSTETATEISKASKDLPPEPGKSVNYVEVIDNSKTEEEHSQISQKGLKRRETLQNRRPEEECPDKKIKLEREMKCDSGLECKVSKSQIQESIFQHNQKGSSEIVRTKTDDKRVSQGETFVQTAVEGKLRELLSKMGPGTSTILSGDLSISFAPIKAVFSGKVSEVSNVSVTSCRTEMIETNASSSTVSEDVQICNSNAMQKSAVVSNYPSELVVGKESHFQDVMVIKEENQPSSSLQMTAEKIVDVEMIVPDYRIEKESPEVKPVESEIVKAEPKKGRGRPRKTALVSTVVPVIEPPLEQVLRPKRMCRGRERPPVVVKVRKPRVGKGK